jgi:hypothetical protein
MKTLCALSLASVGLAACTLPPQTNATNAAAAAPPGHFESVLITGSYNVGDVFLKVNSDTGAASYYCCNNYNFNAINDPAPLPTGKYFLKAWNVINGDNSVTWAAYRFDETTGHTWTLMHEHGGQYQWQALTN